jgi:hypothetical protein
MNNSKMIAGLFTLVLRILARHTIRQMVFMLPCTVSNVKI